MIRRKSPAEIMTTNGIYLYTLKDVVKEALITPTKISHEVPLSMLEMSRWFNDYDYALVHLFDKYPEYFKFYQDSVEMGRMVILDNSLYELGNAFDMKAYAGWIEKLNPTHYILPDAFWDTQVTIDMAMEWWVNYGKYLNPEIKKIGVAQGSTYQEIKKAYQFMDIFCDCIAFTFKFHPNMMDDPDLNLREYLDNSEVCYPGISLSGEDLTPEDKQAICRYLVLLKLEADGVINTSKEHHLLGLQNTTMLYDCTSFPWVTSIDTSNPIINGYLGNIYYFNTEYCKVGNPSHHVNYIGNGGHPKPTIQLGDIFDKMVPGSPDYTNSIKDIMHNVRAFREIVNPLNISAILMGEHRLINPDYESAEVKEFLQKNQQ